MEENRGRKRRRKRRREEEQAPEAGRVGPTRRDEKEGEDHLNE